MPFVFYQTVLLPQRSDASEPIIVSRTYAFTTLGEHPKPASRDHMKTRHYLYGERSVHLDGCVEVDAAYLQRAARMDRQTTPGAVGFPAGPTARSKAGQLLREHLRQARGGHRIKDEDNPAIRLSAHINCWPAPIKPDRRSAPSAAACIRQGETSVYKTGAANEPCCPSFHQRSDMNSRGTSSPQGSSPSLSTASNHSSLKLGGKRAPHHGQNRMQTKEEPPSGTGRPYSRNLGMYRIFVSSASLSVISEQQCSMTANVPWQSPP